MQFQGLLIILGPLKLKYCKTLWTGARIGLLVSVLEKLTLAHLAGQCKAGALSCFLYMLDNLHNFLC